jgi:uncharacterized protein YjiS (DUF1127 family)
MAALAQTRPFIAADSKGQPTNFITAAFAAIVEWKDKRDTRRSLNALTDRELADIGMSRGEIEDVVNRF